MNYINEGFYYRVYESNGRIFKKFQPYWFSFVKIYKLNRKHGVSVIGAIADAHRSRISEDKVLIEMKEKLVKLPLSLFANPVFVGNHLDYSQDKVLTLADALKQKDFEQNKKIIDEYIELQKTFWSYGLHDKTYKFQSNYGINNTGDVVCIDFGEFVFAKEKALKSILSKRWLIRESYLNWEDKMLKDYYTHRINETFTENNLHTLWAKNNV